MEDRESRGLIRRARFITWTSPIDPRTAHLAGLAENPLGYCQGTYRHEELHRRYEEREAKAGRAFSAILARADAHLPPAEEAI